MPLRISLSFLFAFASFHVFANDSTLTWHQWKKDWEKKKINTNRIHVEKEKKLIGNIEILDVRSDTERIGVYTNDFHKPCELILDTSIEFLMNEKLSDQAATSSVLLVLRSFWISEIQNFTGKQSQTLTIGGVRLPATQLKCSIDAFLKHDDKYIPLTQYDTTLTNKYQAAYASHIVLEEAFGALQNKLEETLSSNLHSEKKKTGKENIIRAYSKRFQIAALTDTILKKGVYYTWEQFKNNQPADKEFSIKPNNKKEPPSLFIKDENGNDILNRNVFAVSDGHGLYKIHQGFVFPIYKHNNSIYFTGLEKFDLKTRGAPAGYPLGGGWGIVGMEPMGSVMKIRVTPYLLNLETGEEY